MQEDKIKLYEELLAADPGSRLFLPLARLYLERGEAEKAISTLETGLNRYQEHFEARLLLHETLYEQGRMEEAREHLRMVSEVLRKYPAYWEHWADTVESEGQIDAAVGVRFLARYFQGDEPGWAEVLHRGLLDTRGEEKPSEIAAPSEAEEETVSSESLESDGVTVLSEEEGSDPYRTKTMADILVSQGDYAQALDIYTELEAQASSSGEREKLQERINRVKEQIEANSGDNQILESDLEPEPEQELEPEPEPEPEQKAESELEPDSELEPEEELEPEAELEPEEESVPELKPESEPEQAPEPEQEHGATSEPAFDSEPETELELVPESESYLNPEEELEPEAELEPEEESVPEQNSEAELEPEEEETSSSGGEAELVDRLEKLAERLETRQ